MTHASENIILSYEKKIGSLDKKNLKQLDDLGYCLIEKSDRLINWLEKDLKYITDFLENLLILEGEKSGYEGREEHYKVGKKFEPTANRLGNLPNKDDVFKKFVMFPDLLRCAYHIIQDEIMFSSSNYREPIKNSGEQRLHIDWMPRKNIQQNYESVIAMLYLDDSTVENGATKLIPKSHKFLGWPDESVNPFIDDDRIISVPAKAGSILVINGNLWHKGGDNLSGNRRRIINSTYRFRSLKQGLNQNLYISNDNFNKMSYEEKFIFKILKSDYKQDEKIYGPGNIYREWLKKNPKKDYSKQ